MKKRPTLKWCRPAPIIRPDNIISSKARATNDRGFVPTYEKEKATITFLLSNEYMRKWFNERDLYYKENVKQQQSNVVDQACKRRFINRQLNYNKATKMKPLPIIQLKEFKHLFISKQQNQSSFQLRYKPDCSLYQNKSMGNGKFKLLIVGGRDGLKTLNTMECLDLETGTWSQLSPMNTHRHGLGVAVLGNTLYAVGGHDGWSYLNNVERWDSTARSWSYAAPMQNQRCSAGVAVLKGKLYAVGGRDGSSCLRTVECYDPHINKWTMCAPLSRRRGGVGVAVAGGYLYALGGQDAPANNPAASRFDCVERYDPSTDTWMIIASLSTKRDSIAACLFGDRLVAVGGYDGNNYSKTVEQYDPNCNEWTPLAPLITGRAGACVITISNAINASSD